MSEQLLNREWYDSNEATRYPFSPNATLTNGDKAVILDGTFLDAHLYPVGGEVGIYLSRVEVTNDKVYLWIGDTAKRLRAKAEMPLVSGTDFLYFEDDYGRAAGCIVTATSRVGVFQSWGLGVHDFTRAHTEFTARVCTPQPEQGLSGLVLDDGTVVSGDVWLVGGAGVVFSTEQLYLPATPERDADVVTAVRVDVVGDPLFRRRLCAPDEGYVGPNPISSINVVHGENNWVITPDENGNVSITVGDHASVQTVLRINPEPDGLRMQTVGKDIS